MAELIPLAIFLVLVLVALFRVGTVIEQNRQIMENQRKIIAEDRKDRVLMVRILERMGDVG